MKKRTFTIKALSIITIFIAASFFTVLLPAKASFALSAQEQAVCRGAGGIPSDDQCAIPGNSVGGTIRAVSNILIFIIGAIAVIMIIIGGIRYATSGGDQAQITAAKNTILYSVIGLVVAFMAYGIARFVVDRL